MKVLYSNLKGLIISVITTITLILIFSSILVKTNFREEYIDTVIIIISSISILIGTSIATIKLKKNGIINGIIISITYMLTLYIFSSILNGNFSVGTETIYMLILGIVLGILGGIIGVNIKS